MVKLAYCQQPVVEFSQITQHSQSLGISLQNNIANNNYHNPVIVLYNNASGVYIGNKNIALSPLINSNFSAVICGYLIFTLSFLFCFSHLAFTVCYPANYFNIPLLSSYFLLHIFALFFLGPIYNS
jgi:cytochrome b subunit of formate dehydrogenase